MRQKKLIRKISLNDKTTTSSIIKLTALLLITAGGITYSQEIGDDSPDKLIVNADLGRYTINKNIYGHFAEHLGRCIYEGIWVGEDSSIPNTRGIRKDVVEALNKINVPVLRWPGGCFADTYHWMDGIGPKEARPIIVKEPPPILANEPTGPVTENNHFGTHEFLDLCEQLGADPFITGNVGSGTVQELTQWVEYVNSSGINPMADLRRQNGREKPWNVKYWGLGNESDGCGGSMRPEYYADLFQRYSYFIQWKGDTELYMIAAGPQRDNYEWTEVVMRNAGPGAHRYRMKGLDFHYYTSIRTILAREMKERQPSRLNESASEFGEEEWFAILERASIIDELITNHSNIMDKYDPQKHIGLIVGEWGTWHDVDPGTRQRFLHMENTLRDAVSAGLTLNIFNQHCDRIQMANIAQTVNVLQEMIKTKDKKMILTPTFHVFEMYKVHQDAILLPTDLHCKDYVLGDDRIQQLSVSASKDKSGKIHITIVNLHHREKAQLVCELRGMRAEKITGRILTAPSINAHNTFDNPEIVRPVVFKEVRLTSSGLNATLPAKSVVVLEIE